MYSLILMACLGCGTNEAPVLAVVVAPVRVVVAVRPVRSIAGAVLERQPARKAVKGVLNLRPGKAAVRAARGIVRHVRPVKLVFGR